jgi:filamentous hemagglutinin
VKLTATGNESDILIAFLDAGADTGEFIAQAGRDIREVDDSDDSVDLIAHSSTLSAGRYIGGAFGGTADIDLETDIDILTAVSHGRLSVNEIHDIILAEVSTADGPIGVTVGGSITALQVESGAGEISLSAAGGDIFIGYLDAGFESGTVELAAAGSIREVADHDPDIDLIASQASLSAGADIGNPQNAELTLETRVETLFVRPGNGGSIFINELDGLVLLSVLAPGGAIGIAAGGDIMIDGPISAGTATTLQAGGVITMSGDVPVTSLFLELIAGYGIDVETDVEILAAAVTVQGLIQIDEADNIVLQEVTNAAGAIRITAGGSISALRIEVLSDAPGNNISLLALSGDVLIDYVGVGTVHGQMTIGAAAGDIREIDAFDADVDVAGSLGIFFAAGEIGSKSNPELNLEMALGRFIQSRDGDLKLHVHGDVDLFFIATGKIDVWATGMINALYLVSLTDDIRLTSHCGDINVEYLEAAGSRGDVSLDARGTVYLAAVTSAAGQGRIIAGDDLSIHSCGQVQVHGYIMAGDDVDIWAKQTVSLYGDLTAGDDVNIWAKQTVSLYGDLTAGDDVKIHAGGGVLVQGALVSQQGEVDIDVCWGMLEVTGSIAAAGDVELSGRQGVVAAGEVHSGDDIELKSIRGDVMVAGCLIAAEDVEIHSGSHALIEAAVFGGDDITIWAKDTVSVRGALAAGDNVHIWAGESISISADLNAVDDVSLWAGRTVWVYGHISAADDVSLWAGRTVWVHGDITAGDDVSLWAGRTVWVYGHISAADDVSLWAGRTVWVHGDITAGDDLSIFGGCSVEISGAVEAGDRLYIRSPRGRCKCCRKKTGRC